MRAIVQRVKYAKVTVDNQIVGQIAAGLLVYLGVGKGDDESDAVFIADKISNLRIFADDDGKMNLNVKDMTKQLLIISNFTLYGDCRKGRRPGFDLAAEPQIAEKLYEKVCEHIKAEGLTVQKGIFAADMDVTASNDGPINFLLDSKRLF
ncbi:MAG: D-tyrosyl-tRNA(Tyr) deacylase [Planctomycetes bacterium GWF2_41_51]|nr:MAG: D-tyrosyl-tRNA(Tyr) deacylase [Planctomycetes bacterium GWF2_41_51]HBG27434.1 D-tyrosyl-tRNA(Tyr) deacylase [Phycisphaerales bacterium]